MFRFVSFRGRAQVLLAAVGAFSFGAVAQAELLPGYATGTGANTSSLIIDFAFIGGDAYLFEYHYDGSVTAAQMIIDLDTAGSFDADTSVFDFGGGPLLFVNGFSFGGDTAVPDFVTTGQSWDYWLADEPIADPAAWTKFGLGPSDRDLADGSRDAWSINISEYNQLDLDETADPPTDFSAQAIAELSSELILLPVPEPASATLLVLTGLVALRRRR